ncbi:unnamed protein product [Adineta ricciae]|uniref:Uncharacterized protein n=1 Tax=Adineta ricciae TaxID=249248 RepID=A0A813NDZ6_ADIRI|nr:unnamed protein product [Adineta ricciae]
MILADFIPQTTLLQLPNDMNDINPTDELTKLSTTSSSDIQTAEKEPYLISPIKIPLTSFQPLLAASPDFILTNECTRRRNRLVLIDNQLQTIEQRIPKTDALLDAIWYEKKQQFLLRTVSSIFSYDAITGNMKLIQGFTPTENKEMKCFNFLNSSVLLVAYDEWNAQYIEKWQQDDTDENWKLTDKLPLNLTNNEFIGNMITVIENDCSYIVITIYNDLLEHWRLEIRPIETFLCVKAIILPGSNPTYDYKILSLQDNVSNIKFLVYSSQNSNIIAIDSHWEKILLNYKYPVQRMVLFSKNQWII